MLPGGLAVEAHDGGPAARQGVGEAGSVGSLGASHNAVCNALAPLGISHIEMPLSPGFNLLVGDRQGSGCVAS